MSRPASYRVATHGALGSIIVVLLLLVAVSGRPSDGDSSRSAGPAPAPTSVVLESMTVEPILRLDVPTPTPPAVLARLPLPSSSPIPSVPLSVHAPPRVGIQIGHWLTDEVPEELDAIRTVGGVLFGEWDETVIAEQIARLVVSILTSEGVMVDVLPTTVPEGYSADLFVSLHIDADLTEVMSGFKVARSHWSQDPERDDALVEALINHYGAATGLSEHPQTITEAMTEYYAFNHEKFQHAIAPSTPGLIVEMGFLSHWDDRRLLLEEQDKIAQAIADVLLDFLLQSPEQ